MNAFTEGLTDNLIRLHADWAAYYVQNPSAIDEQLSDDECRDYLRSFLCARNPKAIWGETQAQYRASRDALTEEVEARIINTAAQRSAESEVL
jgi:hypothetical protein